MRKQNAAGKYRPGRRANPGKRKAIADEELGLGNALAPCRADHAPAEVHAYPPGKFRVHLRQHQPGPATRIDNSLAGAESAAAPDDAPRFPQEPCVGSVLVQMAMGLLET